MLVEKLLHQTERRRLETGIVPAKRNLPNVEWMLLVLATLSPDDEIFAKGYMPPQRARKESIAEVALPDDPVFDGLDDVFAGRKRGKKAAGSLFQTRDELLEQRIQAKQQRIEEQLAVARRMETELQTLKDRGPQVLSQRESAHLRELEAQYHNRLHLQAQQWQQQMEASIEQRVQEETERRMMQAMSQMQINESEVFQHPNVIVNEDTEMIDTSSQPKKKAFPKRNGRYNPNEETN